MRGYGPFVASLVGALSLFACANTEEPSSSTHDPLATRGEGLDPSTACPAPFDTPASGPRPGANAGFMAGGQSRTFEFALPPTHFEGPRPLLIAFHGTGETGRSFFQRARLAEFAARGFIVVLPDAVGNGSIWPVWDGMHLPGTENNPNPDLALVDRLLSCTAAHYTIDRSRIFAIGHSAGGIFTNHVLRSRSSVFAGGIVSSGVFDFTTGAPGSSPTLEPMTVIVAWGGDNDGFGGSSPSGEPVSGFTFVEQAAMASHYFESQPAVGQAYCRGNDIGHSWLPLNGWFIDLLLSRPKGTPASSLTLAPLPPDGQSVCSTDAYELPPAVQTTCPVVPREGCRETCQLLADCALENKTVGTSLASELATLGLRPSSCESCVEQCDAHATTTLDAEVLACIAQRQPSTTCGPGIEGAVPLFATIDGCCTTRAGSNLCADLCSKLVDSAAGMLLPSCAGILAH